MNRIEYRNMFLFPLSPAELWTVMERFDLFESWWTWLTDFRAAQPALTGGNVLHAVIAPPALHRLRFDVRLRRCEKPGLIEAAVEGDISGPAVLRLGESAHGTCAEVAWSLTLHSPPLRAAALAAYPLMRTGHDHFVGLAVSRFRSRALACADAASADPGSLRWPQGRAPGMRITIEP